MTSWSLSRSAPLAQVDPQAGWTRNVDTMCDGATPALSLPSLPSGKLLPGTLSPPRIAAQTLQRLLAPMRTVRLGWCVTVGVGVLVGCRSQLFAPRVSQCPASGTPTKVPLLLASTANDRLSEFNIGITGITLGDRCARQVSLFADSAGRGIEFIRLNGSPEPLVTASIPQGNYTSASLRVSGCSFTTVTFDSSNANVVIATYAHGLCSGTGITTVRLPTPVVVGRDAAGLSIDLQVSQSYTLNGTGEFATYTINPVFDLTSIPLSFGPTSDQGGNVDGIDGRVAALDSGESIFSVLTPEGAILAIHAAGGTSFQGIGSVAQLAAGTFVDMSAAIQPDGSLLASRIDVEDPTARDVMVGQVTQVYPAAGVFGIFDREQQGDELSIPSRSFARGGYLQLTGSTLFQIAGGSRDLASLPFTATFDAASLTAGQQTYVSVSNISYCCAVYTQAKTVTLMPQTVNGTVVSAADSGIFRVYRVAIAPYDFIAQLDGATSFVAYLDANTRLLNAVPLGAGNVLQFHGLLFNDHGTLRMACAQVRDGVAEDPVAGPASEAPSVSSR